MNANVQLRPTAPGAAAESGCAVVAATLIEARFEALTPARLERVLGLESRVYDHPWSRSNFEDSLQSGDEVQLLLADETLLGYFVAMKGVDEVHLLNITVAPEHQRQGWAQVMLDGLALWARGQGAQWIWLEVRVGNLRAIQVYEAQGYRRIGQRKDYYPAVNAQREDALVMCLQVSGATR